MGRPRLKKIRRKNVGRNKQLPLPDAVVRAISLQNHLALETMRSGHGASLHATFLFRAVYLTYLLRDTIEPNCEIEVFQEAESALCQCSHRAEASGSYELADADFDALRLVLTLHDWQLQSAPSHLYESACASLLGYLINDGQSVIPASNDEVSTPCIDPAN